MWSMRRSWSEVNGFGGLLLLGVGGELGKGLRGLVLDGGKSVEVAEAEGESRGRQRSKRCIFDMSEIGQKCKRRNRFLIGIYAIIDVGFKRGTWKQDQHPTIVPICIECDCLSNRMISRNYLFHICEESCLT